LASLNGTLPALLATFKWQQIPAVTVFSYRAVLVCGQLVYLINNSLETGDFLLLIT
jgi:hypothetical protein